jgi:ATP-binding protein involved in chromosome partitioning
MPTESLVRDALSRVPYPGFSRDIVSFGLVKAVAVDGDGKVVVKIGLATSDPKVPQQIHDAAKAAVAALPGVTAVELDFDIQSPPAGGPAGAGMGKAAIPGVRRVVAVASGKGGVGKSTVAANLAVALAAAGHRTGLCDCDLYGPSVALMFGASGKRAFADDQERIVPVPAHGVELVSMGFLLDDASPVIVRGPLATRYTQQFLRQVAWGDLDYLVLDLPPGTGDIQLTIVQTVALAGAVIVTTPQEVALIDARKAASMFAKVNVPVLGVVENMSYFECAHGTRYAIFGEGGGAREAERLGVPLLAQVPLDPLTRERGDSGRPVALEDPGANPVSRAFRELATRLAELAPLPA